MRRRDDDFRPSSALWASVLCESDESPARVRFLDTEVDRFERSEPRCRSVLFALSPLEDDVFDFLSLWKSLPLSDANPSNKQWNSSHGKSLVNLGRVPLFCSFMGLEIALLRFS